MANLLQNITFPDTFKNAHQMRAYYTFKTWFEKYNGLLYNIDRLKDYINIRIGVLNTWIEETNNSLSTARRDIVSVQENMNSVQTSMNSVQETVGNLSGSVGKIGDVTQLKTEEKGTLVASNNELYDKIDALETLVGKTGLDVGAAQTIVAVINDLNIRLAALEAADNV